MDTTAFDTAYANLNPQQKKAVDTIEGPVMVVAGPGTGKTQILTLRIANILRRTDTTPQSILAITFTESGVTAMRKRLANIIGTQAYGVTITTFHGFGNDIIHSYPHYFPHLYEAEQLSNVQQVEIIEQCLDEGTAPDLRPAGKPYTNVGRILSTIKTFKEEGYTPESAGELVEQEREALLQKPDLYHEKGAHKGKMKSVYIREQHKLEKLQEYVNMYARYQHKLAELHVYDFSDMLIEVLNVLEKQGELLQLLQEHYQYILIDEHQDTNYVQNRIVQLIASYYDVPNIFVVGDTKQAIYRFQGASDQNFTVFNQTYRDVTMIALVENYRSVQSILHTAHTLFSTEVPLLSQSSREDVCVTVQSYDTIDGERFGIFINVSTAIEEGIQPSEIAILTRTNAQAREITDVLRSHDIAVSMDGGANILNTITIRMVRLALEYIHDIQKEHILAQALHADFFKLDPRDIYRAIQIAGAKHISILDAMQSEDSGFLFPERMTSLAENMLRWHTLAKNTELLTFFELFFRESGLLHALQFNGISAHIDVLNGFFAEMKSVSRAKQFATLSDFLAHLTVLDRHNLGISVQTPPLPNAVRVMTAHRSKGLEFDYVIIPHATEGVWDKRKTFGDFTLPTSVYRVTDAPGTVDPDNDERRLFYVAVTRARHTVVISHADCGEDGRTLVPSRFIEEIRDSVHHKKLVSIPTAIQVLLNQSKQKKEEIDKNYIRSLIYALPITVTALNNYLKCPWIFFYNNLLRLPKAMAPSQMFGTAVHGALKDFGLVRSRGSATKEVLLESFRKRLTEQPLEAIDKDTYLRNGTKMLSGYYDVRVPQWQKQNVFELNTGVLPLTDAIELSGVLDKVELLGGKDVRVVDYKTGKPKSHRELLGETKNATGDYYRQLVFYKLLLSKYLNGRYAMQEGMIDFIHPTEGGVYKYETFHIDQQAVDELVGQIQKMREELETFAFWDKRCDDASCAYCALREMIRGGA